MGRAGSGPVGVSKDDVSVALATSVFELGQVGTQTSRYRHRDTKTDGHKSGLQHKAVYQPSRGCSSPFSMGMGRMPCALGKTRLYVYCPHGLFYCPATCVIGRDGGRPVEQCDPRQHPTRRRHRTVCTTQRQVLHTRLALKQKEKAEIFLIQ